MNAPPDRPAKEINLAYICRTSHLMRWSLSCPNIPSDTTNRRITRQVQSYQGGTVNMEESISLEDISQLADPPCSGSELGSGRSSARSSYQSSVSSSVSSSNDDKVNNGDNTIDSSPSKFIRSSLPPSPCTTSAKSRRDYLSVQKEANRSRKFTTRLQRSASESAGVSAGAPASTDPSGELLTGRRRNRFQNRSTASLPADHGLKAIEPLHEHVMTKMAFAEQQKWITVQQKTFTKW